MISNEKIKLLDIWRKDLFSELTIAEVMKLSKKKTKTWVFNSLNSLVDSHLLISKRKANLNLYKLNLANPLVIHMMQYIEAQESLDSPVLDIVSDIVENIPVKTCSVLVFGSYAEDKQKKGSDLDVCFLTGSGQEEKKIKPYVDEIALDHPVQIDAHYITFDDLIKMLLRKEENLGKQIFRKHRIFYNADIYYQLIKKAYKNGFRP